MPKDAVDNLRREVRETGDAFNQLRERIANLEARVNAVPDTADDEALRQELNAIAEELNAMQQEVQLPTPVEPSTEPETPTDEGGQPA